MIFNYEIKKIYIKNINGEMIKVKPVRLEGSQFIYMGIDAASMEGWADAVMYFKRKKSKEEDVNAGNNS